MNMPHGGTPRGRPAKPVNLAMYPIISHNDEIQDRYMRMRHSGQSHTIAEQNAFRMSASKPQFEHVSDDPVIQGRYDELRANGTDPVWSEMLAFRKAPGVMSDVELNRGVGTLDKQLSRDDLRFLEQDVARNGNPPNPNSVYQPQLARYPFDRRAFVQTGGEIKERAEELGVGVEGFVNVKPTCRLERDPLEGSGKVAPDLQQFIAKERGRKNPGLRGKDLSDDINATHGTNLHKPR